VETQLVFKQEENAKEVLDATWYARRAFPACSRAAQRRPLLTASCWHCYLPYSAAPARCWFDFRRTQTGDAFRTRMPAFTVGVTRRLLLCRLRRYCA